MIENVVSEDGIWNKEVNYIFGQCYKDNEDKCMEIHAAVFLILNQAKHEIGILLGTL